MVLKLMVICIVKILYVKCASLQGQFDEGEKTIYMSVPEVFEGICRSDMVFMLLKAIHVLKNVVKAFWRDLLRAFFAVGCRIRNSYQCIFQVGINVTVGMFVVAL